LSPEFNALSHLKESDWLAIELGGIEEEVTARVRQVFIAVAVLAILYVMWIKGVVVEIE
jgi:hypothetical protein